MTKEDIIKLAREAGLFTHKEVQPELERFANLVAEAERKRLGQEIEQAEPVAYYHPRNGFYWAKPTSIFAPTVVDVPPIPLYTTAAQRPWVGLTDEEIESAISDGFARGLDDGNVSNRAVIHYVRVIEAALKEHNK